MRKVLCFIYCIIIVTQSILFLRCRLRRSENDIRNELDIVRAEARSREEDLMERIRILDLQSVRRNSRETEHETATVQVRLVSFRHLLSSFQNLMTKILIIQ